MLSTGALRWPTLCRACHRWQSHTFCSACTLSAGLDQPRCHRCALPVSFGQTLCQACEDLPPVFDHAIAALDYALPWSHLIARLKFRHDTALARALARMLTMSVQQRWAPRPGARPPGGSGARQPPGAARRLRPGAPTVLLPMPLSPQRLRERGYNQSALLAAHLGQSLALPVVREGLVRIQHTERLMGLDIEARAQHIRGAFAAHPLWVRALRGRHVALIDDVLTTGATANEAARVLWQAGAREVSVWVVARTPAVNDTEVQ
jgi:ComF family protein